MDSPQIYNNLLQLAPNTLCPYQSLCFFYLSTTQFPLKFQQPIFFSTYNFAKPVQVKNFASQTDNMLQNDKIGQSCSDQNQNGREKQNTEFPLPNKQRLFQLFVKVPTKRRQIQRFIYQISNQRPKTLKSFYKSIGEKIMNFKKTKEEIIKFLIRRAWKKQKIGAEESREKYYSQYKSMNSAYLSRIFSEHSFVCAYEQMLKSFDDDFDAFNQERFNRFYEYLLSCYVKKTLSKFKSSRQCNSKLPYPLSWKEEIRKIAHNLYQNNYKNGYLVEKNQSM